ncbi:hypothetical protein EXIGLDRAFT_835381 [Exidia glandulosa HHB12029]|uniref:Uncharacterized protein n=1 Tax=Exidia glandulosa HHB12029 TaxID=1314781 RepID=A0A165ITW6_EXIGL|nr:hypothetical protein EXIGLDRAFT_835381 [Exidia glandulosa HHB12029]
MSSKDAFTPSTTTIEFPWPDGISGIERVFLVANGDLQRLLSAYFARPIDAEVLSTESVFATAEGDQRALPMTQKRVINLLCDGTLVCRATSTVLAKSWHAVELLEQGFFLGQILRTLEQIPQFSLTDVRTWTSVDEGRTARRLARRYTVTISCLECDIEEEFVDRDLFR